MFRTTPDRRGPMSATNPFLRTPESAPARPRQDRAPAPDADNIFRFAATPERARPAAPDPRRVSQPELDAALDMLNRAAKAMDAMQARHQHVEDYAKGVAERAERDIAAAHAQATDWEERARASESRLADSQARIREAERRAELAERGAEEARQWLEDFYDRVMACFDARPLAKAAGA